jgi:DNA-directed RNA polymerase subunit H (RpoH/RPB5)
MNMSKLSQLQGKPQVFTIGEVELTLKPLTVDELELFSIDANAPVEKQMEATKGLIQKVLKKSVPDATDEEIKNISLEYLEELMNAIMKLHKFKEDDSKISMIKNVIQARQNQAKSS